MKRRFLALLACPHDESDFEFVDPQLRDDGEIESGSLRCMAGVHTYPIVRGIPRIIDDVDASTLDANYAESFGFQWTQFAWEDPEVNLREFWNTTDFGPAQLAGKTFLDAGCGGGRTTAQLPELVKEIVYLDYSVAVERAHQKCGAKPNAHFVQASVAKPPLKKEMFDIVFCSGVLHHTPNTYESFTGLPPMVKPGGYLHVYVFRRAEFPARVFHFTDHAIRHFVSRLPRAGAIAFCKMIGVLGPIRALRPLKAFFWFSIKPDPEVRLTHNHDWYACRYHHEHTINEVIGWFVKHGFGQTGYINGWPEAPKLERYEIPGRLQSQRLGLSLTVHGTKLPTEAAPPR
jgi:SAM-dependent methyltransferase